MKIKITRKFTTLAFAISLLFLLSGRSVYANGNAFDLDNGNAPLELIIPNVIPVVLQDVSASAGDASLILRFTTLLTNAWFDATAPYHPTAIGVYQRFDHRVSEEGDQGKNVALLYASYQVLMSLLPHRKATWDGIMSAAGLDSSLQSLDATTPEGKGFLAGRAVVEARQNDGMNQLGNEGDQAYHRLPYADYTNYAPKNSAYVLRFPSRWQPAIVTNGQGLFKVQQFVTPQLRHVPPYSYDDPAAFRAPTPFNSKIWNIQGYRQQAQDVLAASANLTEDQKLKSEFFDNKFNSLGFSAVYAAQTNQLSLLEFVHLDFLVNLAAFDTSIAIWKEKFRHDAVRPFSAIGFLWGGQPVTAWGGPGNGTVDDMPANQWTSYLNVADHPEYPSASASFCAAHALAARAYLGSDALNWSIPAPAGSSLVEPGVTPAIDTQITFATWTDFETDCGDSRVWAGVHFPDSVPAGQAIGRDIAELVVAFVNQHIDGTAD